MNSTALIDTAIATKNGSAVQNFAHLGAAKKAALGSPEAIDKVAEDFESLFLSQMLEQMFTDSIGEDAFGNGESSEVYKSMIVQEYSKRIADSGGIGIAQHIKTELLKLQEVQP